MKEKKIYFKNIPDVGNLNLDRILFEFEYTPIIFTCRDLKNDFYLCLCADIRKIQEWIITPISPELLKRMLKDKITIYDAFKLSDEKKIMAQYTKKDGISYKKVNFNNIDDMLLPDKDEFLEDEDSFSDYIEELEESSLSYSLLNNENLEVSSYSLLNNENLEVSSYSLLNNENLEVSSYSLLNNENLKVSSCLKRIIDSSINTVSKSSYIRNNSRKEFYNNIITLNSDVLKNSHTNNIESTKKMGCNNIYNFYSIFYAA